MKKIKEVLNHPMASSSALLIFGSLGINVINLIYHFVMGNILGPVNYGTLLSLYSILYILSIVPLSSSVAIVKFISKSKSKKERMVVYNAIKKLILYIAIFGSAFVVILSPIISNFLNIKDVVSTLLTAGVLFFSLITLVNQASLQGILKFMGVVLPNFVSSAIKLILGVVLVWVGFSVEGAMFAVVIGVAVAYILSQSMAKKHFSGNSKKEFDLKPFFNYSKPVLLQAFAFTSLFTTDVILVKHFFSPFDAGLYAALSTLGKIVYFGASPVASVMFPYVSGKHSRGEKYIKVLWGALLLTASISFGVVVIYALFPNLVVKILYAKYIKAVPYLVWMGAFIAFYTIANLLTNFFLSIDKLKIVLVPLFFAILQIILIWFYHNSILQVIQVSLIEMIFLCLILFTYLVYNRLSLTNEAKAK
ncbi:MAG: oligosaccharide flippase family protein [Candidatus Woesebacteria bacterium]|nr:MAG: oligosaccharide flippase family protein [Candidatus Woesebacteria bacterium]